MYDARAGTSINGRPGAPTYLPEIVAAGDV
jgi:hypothetical protein